MERSNNPKVVDLPAGERRVLSATAGVLGSVRQNLKWGHYCKVAFRVEFLDAQGRLIGDAFQTGAHGWKHEAEKVSVCGARPGPSQARLTMLCQGSGNNHGAWADLAVSSFADRSVLPGGAVFWKRGVRAGSEEGRRPRLRRARGGCSGRAGEAARGASPA